MTEPEMHEGEDALERTERLMGALLQVPKEEAMGDDRITITPGSGEELPPAELRYAEPRDLKPPSQPETVKGQVTGA